MAMPRLLYLLLLVVFSSVSTCTTSPIPCLNRPPVSLCDPLHLLTPRGRSHILLAATRLTLFGCDRVLIDLSPFSTSAVLTTVTDPSVCHLRVGSGGGSGGSRFFIRIPQIRPGVAARVSRTLRAHLRHGCHFDDAILSALLSLCDSSHKRESWSLMRFMPLAVLLLSAAVVLFARARLHNRSTMSYERCRQALKRLDDTCARARTSRYGDAKCPICLDDFHIEVSTSAHDARAGRTVGAARRVPGRLDGDEKSHSSGTSSESVCGLGMSGEEDEVVTKRTLPCGHSFHETCLLQWLCSQARNRAACPVCRTPTGRECSRRPRMFWNMTMAPEAVSDNRGGGARTEARLIVEENSVTGSVEDFSEHFEDDHAYTAQMDDDRGGVIGSEVTISDTGIPVRRESSLNSEQATSSIQ